MFDKFELRMIDASESPVEGHGAFLVILNKSVVFSSDDPRQAIKVHDLMVNSYERGKSKCLSALQKLPRFTEITFLQDSVFEKRTLATQPEKV